MSTTRTTSQNDSPRFYTGWVGRRSKKGLTKAECKKRRLSRRGRYTFSRRTKQNTRTLSDYVGVAAAADHRRQMRHVQSACRKVLGTCWHSSTITPEQQTAIYRVAEADLKATGIRFRADQLARSVRFWINAYDSAKALRFKLADVGLMVQEIERHFPQTQLDAVNTQHADKLDGRKLDFFRLALVCCATAKNSLVANRRTRIEECGTSALVELLAEAGINANGSMIRIARDILESIGLIRCIDRSYRTASTWYNSAGRCQRWAPAGVTWDLPFLKHINRDELTEAQRAEYDAHQVAKENAEQTRLRHSHSMVSEHLPLFPSLPSLSSLHTLIRQCEAPTSLIQGHDEPLQGVLSGLREEIMGMYLGSTALVGQGSRDLAPAEANDWDGSVIPEEW